MVVVARGWLSSCIRSRELSSVVGLWKDWVIATNRLFIV